MLNSKPVTPDERFDRINRYALVLLGTSAAIGAACTLLGVWLWTLEWAVAAGIGATAVVWGFVGSLSWVTSEGAARIEAATASAAVHRRLRAGTAEPARAGLSLVADSAEGAVSPPSQPR